MENQNQKISKIWKKEYCSRQRAKWLLENHKQVKIREVIDPTYDPYENVIKFCKSILNNKSGVVNQCYTQKNGIGRFYLGDGKSGYQNMMREFRNMLCCKDYYDVDIKNCHPVLLSQYAKKNKLDCDALNDYVKNRDKYIKEGLKFGLQRQDVKDLFLFIMFGNSGDKETLEKIKGTKLEEIFKIYKAEVKKIQKYIYENEKEIQEIIDKKEKDNKNGSACSLYLQNEENKIIQVADKFLTKMRYHVSSLIFDGCQVRKTKELGAQVLIDLNKEVKKKTGYEVEFLIKEWDKVYDIPEKELNFNIDIYLVDNQTEACDVMIELIGDLFIKSDECFFEKIYQDSNIYAVIEQKKLKERLLKYVTDTDIQLRCEKQNKNISKNTKQAKDIIEQIISRMPDNKEFKTKLNESTIDKICFLNGYYDLIEKEFCDYNEDIVTVCFVNQKYEAVDEKSMQVLTEKIVNRILYDEEQRKWYLNWLCRGLAGHSTNKTWIIGAGNRNSGKSVITDLSSYSLNNYVGTFNAEELACSKGGTGDIAKKLMWVAPFEYTRLLFSNELKTEDDKGNKLKLDGCVIKQIASGGDKISCRSLYNNAKDIRLKSRMCLFMNQVPEISPNDASETLSIVQFSSIFKESITEKEQKINEIDGGCKFFEKDDKIKNLIKDPKICNAWIHLLIENYDNKPYTHFKENVEDMYENKNDEETIINNAIEYTFKKEDKLTNSELREVFQNINVSKISMILKKNGGEPYRDSKNRGFSMIKLK